MSRKQTANKRASDDVNDSNILASLTPCLCLCHVAETLTKLLSRVHSRPTTGATAVEKLEGTGRGNTYPPYFSSSTRSPVPSVIAPPLNDSGTFASHTVYLISAPNS